jgi:hypothetical protein
MKRLCFFAMAVVFLVGTALYSFAANEDFDGLVSEVAQRYDAHATRIPMMSVVSLCARFTTHGGVKGLRLVEFHDVHGAHDVLELTSLVRNHLGSAWQPFLHERDNQGERESAIFVRESGDAIRLMIADYNHGELELVRMELSGDALAKWMKDPQGGAPH